MHRYIFTRYPCTFYTVFQEKNKLRCSISQVLLRSLTMLSQLSDHVIVSNLSVYLTEQRKVGICSCVTTPYSLNQSRLRNR